MKRLIYSIIVRQRAQRLAEVGKTNFGRAVSGCADVSRYNRALCFMVARVGPFGWPKVQWIERPSEVVMFERFNGVIVKDGRVYELTRG